MSAERLREAAEWLDDWATQREPYPIGRIFRADAALLRVIADKCGPSPDPAKRPDYVTVESWSRPFGVEGDLYRAALALADAILGETP